MNANFKLIVSRRSDSNSNMTAGSMPRDPISPRRIYESTSNRGGGRVGSFAASSLSGNYARSMSGNTQLNGLKGRALSGTSMVFEQ